MYVNQLYEYFAVGLYGIRGDRHDCRIKGTHDDIAKFLRHDMIYTRAVWWESMPSVPEIADVPNEREEHEKFSDEYLLEQFYHHQRVGRRRRTEEANLTKVIRIHECERDLVE